MSPLSSSSLWPLSLSSMSLLFALSWLPATYCCSPHGVGQFPTGTERLPELPTLPSHSSPMLLLLLLLSTSPDERRRSTAVGWCGARALGVRRTNAVTGTDLSLRCCIPATSISGRHAVGVAFVDLFPAWDNSTTQRHQHFYQYYEATFCVVWRRR